ncbi:hypothetical protein LAZ67_X004613 [Cordylochernes scorpioides]|uniref:Uncharacterized protein n=1 Tax=Cordylochernes scorpioides TaxID=51811 RepID=A0ABY6LVE0_9ARAC|nr:hypothetical protein LAZ67_X004613 [Cordylochernes scorpioides]
MSHGDALIFGQMIKHFGDEAKNQLLRILNISWQTGEELASDCNAELSVLTSDMLTYECCISDWNGWVGAEKGIGCEGWGGVGRVGICVRQGYILSPYFLNLYTEHIMRLADLDKIEIGVHIKGMK